MDLFNYVATASSREFAAHNEEFVRSRMHSAGYYRPGGSSLTVRVVGVIATSLERLSAAVRRWAREPGDSQIAPHRSALVRH